MWDFCSDWWFWRDDINIKGLENYQVDSDDDDRFESENDSFKDESDTAPSTNDEGATIP